MAAAFDTVERDRGGGPAIVPADPCYRRAVRPAPGRQRSLNRRAASIEPREEVDGALNAPDPAPPAAKTDLPAVIWDHRIGRTVDHHHRHGWRRAGFNAGRHIGDHGADASEQVSRLADQREAHHAAIGDACEIDPAWIGNS